MRRRKPHTYADTNPYTDYYANGDNSAVPDSNGHTNANADSHSDGHGNIHADTYSYRYVHTDSHSDRYVHAYRHSNGHVHTNSNGHINSDAYGHTNANANTYSDSYGYGYAYSDANANGYVHADSYRDGDCHSNAHTDADGYGYSYSYCYSDLNADSDCDEATTFAEAASNNTAAASVVRIGKWNSSCGTSRATLASSPPDKSVAAGVPVFAAIQSRPPCDLIASRQTAVATLTVAVATFGFRASKKA